jgi:serine/threonine protein kinase
MIEANLAYLRSFLTPSQHPGILGRLGHYDVLEIVGAGTMGIVLKARDAVGERIVAIKLLLPHLVKDTTARQRFLREARVAAAVANTANKHVVIVHEVGEMGVPYLVMEFIAGVNLQQHVHESGPLASGDVVEIGCQVAEGLMAIHAHGLVHRDIEPGNILLEKGSRHVKIVDFGIARGIDDATQPRVRVIVGTPPYMSPEQARGDPVDQRSDLFSLGSVLYFLCTDLPAFQGADTTAILNSVCEATPRPIHAINPHVPGWLADLVDRLHAKEPRRRFQSAQVVRELFEAHRKRHI